MWNGLIDEVSMWDLALSQEQISKLMFQRPGGNEPAFWANWGFTKGQGMWCMIRRVSIGELKEGDVSNLVRRRN